MVSKALPTAVLLAAVSCISWSEDSQFNMLVPVTARGTAGYYVDGHIEGFGEIQLLVDTGSGYSAIDEAALAVLEAKGKARYLKQLRGIMADGSRKIVPVYVISSLNIGSKCVVENVEAAIFPADTRPILGLKTLLKVSPFTFSKNPPSLLLSNCSSAVSEDGEDHPLVPGKKLNKNPELVRKL